MVRYIKGKYVMNCSDGIVLENDSGIGFLITIPKGSPIYSNNFGDIILVYVELVVRENDLKLFGFHNIETLELFKLLTTVSGIGPKGAISILDCFSSQDLKSAIINKDSNMISKANGIGKKTAERIVLELKDKIEIDGEVSYKCSSLNNMKDEAISALIALGYSKNEASKAIIKINNNELTCEEYIKLALKELI